VRILINVRRDQWRKEDVRRRHHHELRPLVATPHAEGHLIDRAVVWQALDRLPPRRRAILVLHELDGMPVADVASHLGISAITVRWHLSRGRRALADILTLTSGAPDEQRDKHPAGCGSDSARSAAL
jgi:RNA polymerase sigma-70 factor (ECF subfamily)